MLSMTVQLGYGIAELFRLRGTSWDEEVQACLQAGTVRAGCPGLCPVRFWLSQQMEAPHLSGQPVAVLDHSHNGLVCYKSAFLAHGQLNVHKFPKVFLCRATGVKSCIKAKETTSTAPPSPTELVAIFWKIVVLVKCDFLFLNPFWLLPGIFLSFMSLERFLGLVALSLSHGQRWEFQACSSWLFLIARGEDRSDIGSLPMFKNSPASCGIEPSLVMYNVGISCSELSIIVLAKQHPKRCLPGHYRFWSRWNIDLLTLPFQPFCLILGINFGHLLQLVTTFHKDYGNWVYLKSTYLTPIWLHFFGFMIIFWRHKMAKAFQ